MMIARQAKLSRHTPHMRPAAHKNMHAGPACTFFLFKSVLPYTGRHRPVRKGLTHGLRAFLLCKAASPFIPRCPYGSGLWPKPAFSHVARHHGHKKPLPSSGCSGAGLFPACVWHAGFRGLFRPWRAAGALAGAVLAAGAGTAGFLPSTRAVSS